MIGKLDSVYEDGTPIAINDQLTNCAYATSDSYSDDDCVSYRVVEPSNTYRYSKWDNISSNVAVPGTEVQYSIRAGMLINSSFRDSNFVMIDLLPEELQYVPDSWKVVEIPYSMTSLPDPHFEEIPNWDGTGRAMLRFTWSDAYSNNFTLAPRYENQQIRITFDALIKPTVSAGTTIENCVSVFSAQTENDYNTKDNNDYDKDGDRNENFGSDCTRLEVIAPPNAAALDTWKWVIGELDTEYSRYPEIGHTVNGGIADYKLIFENPSSIDITDVVVIDVFPHVGDTGVLDNQPRDSEWRPVLADPIIPPAGITVEYSLESNPCRDELEYPSDGVPNNFPGGCVTPNWSDTPPLDLTRVKAIRLDFGSMIIAPGDRVEINWVMRAPLSAAETSVAWNSFAYTSTNASTGQVLLPAEPIKVGIDIAPEAPAIFGNYVWLDEDGDGIQDTHEFGIDGIKVELYKDDGDNVPEPTSDDQKIRNTITNEGGYYIFPNLPPGNYFAVFSPFTGYTISPTDVGSDDTKDSDERITPVTNLTDVESDLSWDLGLIPLSFEQESYDCGEDIAYETYMVGVLSQDAYCFSIPNSTNVIGVTGEVWAEGASSPNAIRFNTGGANINATGVEVSQVAGDTPEKLYSASFDGNFNQICFSGAGSSATSFAIYVKRSVPGGSSSLARLYQEFHNGFCRNIDLLIGESLSPRDIEIAVPIHEKSPDPRLVEITVEVRDGFGNIVANDMQTFSNQNAGTDAAIYNMTLSSVQGDATDVRIVVCSPNFNGESFGVGGVVTSTSGCIVCNTPNAISDNYSNCPNENISGDVSNNDQLLSTPNYTILNDVDYGTLSLNTNGTFTYSPSTDFCGDDSFVYQVCNNGRTEATCCHSATVSLSVEDNNNPILSANPGNGTFEFESVPSAQTITATDDCFGGITVVFVESDNQGADASDCSFYEYEITRTWTATDECGNQDQHIQNIWVEDNTPAVISPSNPILIGLNNGDEIDFVCNNIPTFLVSDMTVTDNADTGVQTTINQTILNGNCPIDGYLERHTWIWEATDACGNIATFEIFVNIIDTANPILSVQAQNSTPICDGLGNSADLNTWLTNNAGAEASDNCTSVNNLVWTNNYLNNISDDCGATGSVDVIFTVKDECGNSETTSASFTIIDNQKPQIESPALDSIVPCDGAGNILEFNTWLNNNGGATAIDVCDDNITWSNVVDVVTDECCSNTVYDVTFIATDDCDNSESTSATFTIEDKTPPSAVCKDITIQLDGSGQATITPEDLDNGSSDICCTSPNLSFIASKINFNTSDVGENNVVLTVTDACGNSSTCSAKVTVESFDLAIRKEIASTTAVPGGEVTFTITVFNQGSLDANNVQVVEYIPFGLTLNDSDWTSTGSNAIYTFPGTIVSGTSSTVDVTFTVNSPLINGSQIVNATEIINAAAPVGFLNVDIDSTPDNNSSNDSGGQVNTVTDNSLNNENGDEDDHDVEDLIVEVNYDLSLIIELESGQLSEVEPGDEVAYTVSIKNQGDVNSNNFIVKAQIPAGTSYVSSSDGGVFSGGIITWIISSLNKDLIKDLNLILSIDDAELRQYRTWAEISEDGSVDYGVNDEDSTPDMNIGYDNAQGFGIDPNDQFIDQSDVNVDNATGDEDDNDFADVNVNVDYDLSLVKNLKAGQVSRFYEDDIVVFEIQIKNQGNVPSNNYSVIDQLPAGFTFISATNGGLNNLGLITWSNLPNLDPNEIAVLEVSTQITNSYLLEFRNWAEIIADSASDYGFGETDEDSTPDNNTGEDNGVGFGTPPNDQFIDQTDVNIDNEPGDEDDNDFVDIPVEIFDLALRKTLSVGEDERVYPGESVTFTIEVFNQGTVPAENIQIIDFIPIGLTLNDIAWSSSGVNAIRTIPGPIAPGASVNVDISFLVNSTNVAGSITNIAEVLTAEDELGFTPKDNDSTADNDNSNDTGGGVNVVGQDDEINDDGSIDEDDSDPEDIQVEIYDLALRKTLSAGSDARLYPGQTITFDIEVFNQGTVSAQNIEVQDYIPSGLILTDGSWTEVGGIATRTIVGPIASGSSEVIQITFEVAANASVGLLRNTSEILSFEDEFGDTPNDNDSSEDSDSSNDTTTDNEINNGSSDEDDSDIEDLDIQIFDLALRKTLKVGEDERVYPGEDITFTIEVHNQGTVSAQDITISDYIPSGLSLNDGAWTAAARVATYTVSGPLAAGTSTNVDITFTVDATSIATGIVNRAEISGASDDLGDNTVPDNDSTADNDDSNDTGGGVNVVGQDDEINDDGSIDEDDSDPEDIQVEIYDLALRKTTLTTDIVKPGDIAEFEITIFNQGTVEAVNVEVVDYLPNYFNLSPTDNNGWVLNGNNVTNTLTSPIVSGGSVTIQLLLEVQPLIVSGNYDNYSEIVTAEDDFGDSPEDNDSTPDAQNNNDNLVDNEINNDSGDEDDHDISQIEACDDQAPILSGVPLNITLECDEVIPDPPTIGVGITATDYSNDDFEITLLEESTQGLGNDCSNHTYIITRIWTVVDECDNSNISTQEIFIEDTTSPVINNEAQNLVVECDGAGNSLALQNWLSANANAIVTDNCSDVSWSNNFTSLSDNCGETGSALVVFTAQDVCGNTVKTSATFTINDMIAPDIEIEAANMTVECDGSGNVAAYQAWLINNGGATASDVCGGVSWSNNAGSFSDECGATGFVNVTFTAMDDCGNTSLSSAIFTIEDTVSQ